MADDVETTEPAAEVEEQGPQPVEPTWMLVRLLLPGGAEHKMIMQAGSARELAQRKSDRVNGSRTEGRRVDVTGLDQHHNSMRVVCALDDLTAVILVEMAARADEPVGGPEGQES